MEKTKRNSPASLRMKRIASLKFKIRGKKVQKASKRTTSFASLEHLLNAAGLYQIGEYERASLAFQRAMSEADAPEMLESLEETQAQLEGGDPESVENLDVESGKDTCTSEDLTQDYLEEDFEPEEVSVEDFGEDLEVGESTDLEDLEDATDLEEDELSSDVMDGSEDDFSVEDSDPVDLVESRSRKNLLAMKKALKK